jgi:Sulfatase-modifying factor enzyme 1
MATAREATSGQSVGSPPVPGGLKTKSSSLTTRTTATFLALILTACGSDAPSSWSYGNSDDAGVDGDPQDALTDQAQDVVSDQTQDSDPQDVADVDVPDGITPGAGWIGAACDSAQACSFDGAQCLMSGFPDGMCTLPCDGLCPDSTDANDPITFCTAWPESSDTAACFSRCDWRLFPQGGCRDGYACRWRERFLEPGVVRPVCVVDDGTWQTACLGDEVRQPNLEIEEPAGLDGCPPGMAATWAGVCMDRWEGHLVELLANGSTFPWSPYFNPSDVPVRAVSAPNAVPQGYITQVQADAACFEAGKRLCSRAEWEDACGGPSENTYPYGGERLPGVCNDARSQHPAVELFGTTDDWIWSELGHPCLNQLDDGLAPTGSYDGCVSEDGIFDMMGNLHEWVDDPAGTFKGGFYVDTVVNGNGCLYTTTAHDVSHWDYSTGFRCCY